MSETGTIMWVIAPSKNEQIAPIMIKFRHVIPKFAAIELKRAVNTPQFSQQRGASLARQLLPPRFLKQSWRVTLLARTSCVQSRPR